MPQERATILKNWLPICLFANWGGLFLLLGYSPDAGHLAVRLIAGVLLIATAIQISRGRRDLLISPLFLLAASAIVFFSFGTWLLVEALPPLIRLQAEQLAAMRRFTVGAGELVVVQFAVLALLATSLLNRVLAPACNDPADMRVSDNLARPFVVLSFALLLLAQLPFLFSGDGGPISGRGLDALFREFRQAAPAAMSFAVTVLFFVAVRRRRSWLFLAGGGAAIVCATIFSGHMAKIAIFITLSGIGAYIVYSRLPPRRAAVLVALAAVFLVTSLTVVSVFRPSSGPVSIKTSHFYDHFVRKIFERQAATAGCLQEVIEKRAPDGQGDSIFYFVSSVVPRVLWPEKPSLSRGKEYALDYCGFKTADYSGKFPHSASITLLGEPIVEKGWSGLIVAQTCIVALLILSTLAGAKNGMLGAAAMVAMLPWLADFDQHFALYWALSTKMALFMVPIILVYWGLGRKLWAGARRQASPEGAGVSE